MTHPSKDEVVLNSFNISFSWSKSLVAFGPCTNLNRSISCVISKANINIILTILKHNVKLDLFIDFKEIFLNPKFIMYAHLGNLNETSQSRNINPNSLLIFARFLNDKCDCTTFNVQNTFALRVFPLRTTWSGVFEHEGIYLLTTRLLTNTTRWFITRTRCFQNETW